jgi:hypothetical protein
MNFFNWAVVVLAVLVGLLTTASAGATALNYCGALPVTYSLTAPTNRAGFVWDFSSGTLSCGLASVQYESPNLRVGVFCTIPNTSQETLVQEVPGYFIGSLAISCPEGASIMVAVFNTASSIFNPVNVSYNFVVVAAKQSGEKYVSTSSESLAMTAGAGMTTAATAAPIQYCDNTPVTYLLTNRAQRAGFVWDSSNGTLHCAFATSSRASPGLRVGVYCVGPDSSETLVQSVPGYFSGSLPIACPAGFTIMVATSNENASSLEVVNVTYNFVVSTPSMHAPRHYRTK